jgi:hypothetical protein
MVNVMVDEEPSLTCELAAQGGHLEVLQCARSSRSVHFSCIRAQQ